MYQKKNTSYLLYLLVFMFIITIISKGISYSIQNPSTNTEFQKINKAPSTEYNIINVTMIMSKSLNHPDSRIQQIGILDRLQEYKKNNPGIWFNIRGFYMRADTYTNSQKLKEQARYAKTFITIDTKADIVITIGEEASAYVGNPLFKEDYKIFSSGARNSTIRDLKIPGVYLEYSLEAFSKFRTKTHNTTNPVVVIASSNPTKFEAYNTSHLRKELKKYKIKYELSTVTTKAELINTLKKHKSINNPKFIFILAERVFDVSKNELISKFDLYHILEKYNVSNIEILKNFHGVKNEHQAMSIGPDYYDVGYKLGNLIVMYLQKEECDSIDNYILARTILNINYDKFINLHRASWVGSNLDIINNIY